MKYRNSLARYYRIAAANGDYKANVRLQYLLNTGRISTDMPQTEVHNLNEELAKQLPATAYHNLYRVIWMKIMEYVPKRAVICLFEKSGGFRQPGSTIYSG